MKKELTNPEFLQSPAWMYFQKEFGRKIFNVTQGAFQTFLIQHDLPLVGKYLYCPRGPEIFSKSEKFANRDNQILGKVQAMNFNEEMGQGICKMIHFAKNENVGWIRIEPRTEQLLECIKQTISEKIVKAPYDVQPKEIFVIDISKSEEDLLASMKPKTRYNINLARKKGVIIRHQSLVGQSGAQVFLKLTREMADRNGIAVHPENYYRKMIETLPSDMLEMYTAQYDGKIIAANLIVFYDTVATYLHGASSNEHRNVMAPFLLQWQAILDARKRGCRVYDFGGVKTIAAISKKNMPDWQGITNFKLGFSPNTKPVIFPGTYDIVINPRAYMLYRGLQRAKMMANRLKK